MNNAVFTVIFPKNLIFINDFINCINNQTCKSFDLIIFNDGIDNVLLENHLKSLLCNYKIFQITGVKEFSKIREIGFYTILREGYKNIIFIDSDDIMSNQRVELSLNGLNKFSIIINDLTLIDKNGKILKQNIWKDRLENSTISLEFLLDKNVMGLGNSALRSELLYNLTIPNEIIATDWYMFTKLLFCNKNIDVKFEPNILTYYRQHESNSIGSNKKMTVERLEYILKVKELQYHSFIREDAIFLDRYQNIKKLQNQINYSSIDYINTLNINFFWWEETNFLRK